MKNVTSRVGADLKQTHERDQNPLLHRSLEFRLDGYGHMKNDAINNFRLFAAQQARADALELALRLVHKAEKPQDAAMVSPNANTMEPTPSDHYSDAMAFGVTGRR